MAITVYKGAYLPTVAGDAGTWGTLLNTTTFPVFDNNLGGIVSKSLTNADVTLSASESQMAILRLTGTLTGNIQITTACQGFTFVENLTSGAFFISLTNGVGTPCILPRGRNVLIIDTTNGVRIAPEVFPAGTTMLFVQTAAPTGWTKSTAHNDKALRIVSGTASSGGSTAFSSVFAARTIVAANLPVTSPWAISDPGHFHTYQFRTGNKTLVSADMNDVWHGLGSANTNTVTTGITLANNAGGGTSINFAVAYVDCIIAVKD